MDDIGASSKQYNQHGKKNWKIFGTGLPLAFFANWLFIKRCRPFARWAIYPELTVDEWSKIFLLLRARNANLTVGVTACWAYSENHLIPFYEKFPEEASILKEGLEEGLIEIANHGLCHCVLKDNLFHPRPFSSNRIYHREFWHWLPDSLHKEHMYRSQELITDFFKTDIVTFIPPGGVWTQITERYASEVGIRFISAKEEVCTTGKESNGILYIGNENMIDFHDRDIKLFGVDWLKNKMDGYSAKFCTVGKYFK